MLGGLEPARISIMPDSVPLLCLPFAGAGASYYFPWRKVAPAEFVVTPLQLPGRERLIDEPPYPSIQAAAAGLLATARQHPGPIAIFGHSMGAILGYELAQAVIADGGAVTHLFVSGSQGPWNGRTEYASGLSDDEFLAQVQQFAGYSHPAFEFPEMRELLLPTLRADVAMHESYVASELPPLNVPITAIRGLDDHLVSADAAARWREATTGQFEALEVPGGHMYLDDNPDLLLALIAARLGGLVDLDSVGRQGLSKSEVSDATRR